MIVSIYQMFLQHRAIRHEETVVSLDDSPIEEDSVVVGSSSEKRRSRGKSSGAKRFRKVPGTWFTLFLADCVLSSIPRRPIKS